MEFERCVKMARVNLDEGFDTTATAYAVQALEALAAERAAAEDMKRVAYRASLASAEHGAAVLAAYKAARDEPRSVSHWGMV